MADIVIKKVISITPIGGTHMYTHVLLTWDNRIVSYMDYDYLSSIVYDRVLVEHISRGRRDQPSVYVALRKKKDSRGQIKHVLYAKFSYAPRCKNKGVVQNFRLLTEAEALPYLL